MLLVTVEMLQFRVSSNTGNAKGTKRTPNQLGNNNSLMPTCLKLL